MPRGQKQHGEASRAFADSVDELSYPQERTVDTLSQMMHLKEAFDDFSSMSRAGAPTTAHNYAGFTKLQSQGAIRMRMRLARKLADKQKGHGATYAKRPAENAHST